jgi:hypothetical protein
MNDITILSLAARSPQATSLILSISGIVFLFISLLLVGLNRVPTLKTPQVIEAFGVKLNVSVFTVLVLVGFILAVTSIYLQVRDYEGQIADKEKQIADKDKTVQGLQEQLLNYGRVNFRPLVVLGGISREQMPTVNDVICTYTLMDGTTSLDGNAKVARGIGPTSFQVILEDIPVSANIIRLEIKELRGSKPRTWTAENLGYPLAPSAAVQMNQEGP